MKGYISLGSNLGERKEHIEKAIELLSPYIKKVSAIIETDPLEMADDARKFLNAVAEIETELEPEDLLNILEDVEKELGRTDKGMYKSRTIDLDILLYGSKKINTERLTIPHPSLKKREFLCELLQTLK